MLKGLRIVKVEYFVFLQRMLKCIIIFINLCKFEKVFMINKAAVHINIA